MSGIPERNGIPRLDEVMSGVVRVDTNRMIRLLYSYNSLRVTDCRCGSAELSCRTDWFVYVAGFYSQLASRVIHTGSVQSGCLPRAPRGVILNTSCHHTFYAYVITKLHQGGPPLTQDLLTQFPVTRFFKTL